MTDPQDKMAMRDFAEEAHEHIITLNKDFLELEDLGSEAPAELVNEAFRAIHTIKGLSGMLGFGALNELAHGMEDALDTVRRGEARVVGTLAQALFEGLDLLSVLVASASRGEGCDADIAPALAMIAAALESARSCEDVSSTSAAPSPAEPVNGDWRGYTDRGLSVLSVAIVSARDTSAERKSLLGALELLEGLGEVLSLEPADIEKKLRARRKLKTIQVTAVIATRLSIGEVRGELGLDSATVDILATPSAEQEPDVAASDETAAPVEASTGIAAQAIRVDVAKLDRTLALVGELVILRSRYNHVATQALTDLKNLRGASRRVMGLQSELNEVESAMNRTLSELQDAVMKSRLVPLGTVFGRMQRTIRDVSTKRNKLVRFESSGGETELDKKVLDRMADPLLHLVRNAVDHGIELPADRRAKGKDEEGQVSLHVRQEGDRIVIEAIDDGRGLDKRRIAMRAVERGLVSADKVSELTDPEIHALICAPGFSTASEVTDVSGRGVGMDVVNEAVAGLKGTLRIDSTSGVGSTFRITLPLTMAIMDALLVSVGGELYAVPVSSVKEIVELPTEMIHEAAGREFFQGKERVVPLVGLSKALGAAGSRRVGSQTTVVVDSGEGQVGLTVDRVVRQQEIVVKSLSRRFERVREISGGSVLGDGSVCLILDVPSLVERFDQETPELAGAEA